MEEERKKEEKMDEERKKEEEMKKENKECKKRVKYKGGKGGKEKDNKKTRRKKMTIMKRKERLLPDALDPKGLGAILIFPPIYVYSSFPFEVLIEILFAICYLIGLVQKIVKVQLC
jgi:hypothetical protein